MIVSRVNTRPSELKPGMVMVCTVTLHIGYMGGFRVYQGDFPPQFSEDGIPQGSRISGNQADAVAEALFPVTYGMKSEV